MCFRRGRLRGTTGCGWNKVAQLRLRPLGDGDAGGELVVFLFRGSGWLGSYGSGGWCLAAAIPSCSSLAGWCCGGFGEAEALMLLWLVLLRSLLRGGGASFNAAVGPEMLCWRWASSDLFGASSAVAATPVRWSCWTLARRLPVRVIYKGWAGQGCGAAVAACLRLALEFVAVEHLRELFVISTLYEVLCTVFVPS